MLNYHNYVKENILHKLLKGILQTEQVMVEKTS